MAQMASCIRVARDLLRRRRIARWRHQQVKEELQARDRGERQERLRLGIEYRPPMGEGF
jgi:hypothetical protein